MLAQIFCFNVFCSEFQFPWKGTRVMGLVIIIDLWGDESHKSDFEIRKLYPIDLQLSDRVDFVATNMTIRKISIQIWNMNIRCLHMACASFGNQFWFRICFTFALEFDKRLFPPWINWRLFTDVAQHTPHIYQIEHLTKTMRHTICADSWINKSNCVFRPSSHFFHQQNDYVIAFHSLAKRVNFPLSLNSPWLASDVSASTCCHTIHFPLFSKPKPMSEKSIGCQFSRRSNRSRLIAKCSHLELRSSSSQL